MKHLSHRTCVFVASAILFCLPSPAAGQTGTPAIAFGSRHAVALRSNGDVLTWGENVGCQLGRRGGNASATPTLVMRNAKAIAAASDHTLALATDGKVFGWGTNPEGALGTGSLNDECEGPTLVSSLEALPIAHIATGYGFSVAVTAGGDLYCSGDNSMGQCPVARTGRLDVFTPVPNPLLAGQVAGVAAGAFHTLVLLKDGTVYAFGRGREGQLGNGRSTNGAALVADLTDVTSIAAGTWHSAAVRRDGTAWVWGSNQKSQLCDGATTNRALPAKVETLPAGATVSGVAAGGHATLVRAADGVVYGCGDNQFGALGADRPPVVPRPATIATGTHVAGLAIGGSNGAFSPDGCAVRLAGSNDRGIVSATGTSANLPFTARGDLSLCGTRPAAPLATIVNPAPRGGQSGCWTPRVEEDAVASPAFAPLRQAMLAAEDLLRKNTVFMAAPAPSRMRTSIAAGPADGTARMHVKVVPERKTDGTRLWTGECGVIPQVDRIGGAISQISVFFNLDARGPMLAPTGAVPKQTSTVAGYPEYNGWILITNGGRLPWIPLTLADKLDAEGTRRRRALAEWNASRANMKSPDAAAQQKMYEAVKKTDPAGAEKMLADLKAQSEELARLQRDVYPKTTAALEKAVTDYEAYRATFTPADLNAAAVWGDSSGAGKRALDAEIAALQRLSPEEQQQIDTFNRETRAIEARLVRQRHTERVAPLMAAATARYELTNLRPGPADRAMGVKPDPAFPDLAQPNRIQAIAISFSSDPDPRQTARRAWQQQVKDTFDFATLAGLIK